mmetsp:Transcript_1728/g.3675  ORF Transcript_1728/g.3675 Transcript_1728/m.3675 type:complete len:298 (+) Transcript_1728:1070-1963(+)
MHDTQLVWLASHLEREAQKRYPPKKAMDSIDTCLSNMKYHGDELMVNSIVRLAEMKCAINALFHSKALCLSPDPSSLISIADDNKRGGAIGALHHQTSKDTNHHSCHNQQICTVDNAAGPQRHTVIINIAVKAFITQVCLIVTCLLLIILLVVLTCRAVLWKALKNVCKLGLQKGASRAVHVKGFDVGSGSGNGVAYVHERVESVVLLAINITPFASVPSFPYVILVSTNLGMLLKDVFLGIPTSLAHIKAPGIAIRVSVVIVVATVSSIVIVISVAISGLFSQIWQINGPRHTNQD